MEQSWEYRWREPREAKAVDCPKCLAPKGESCRVEMGADPGGLNGSGVSLCGRVMGADGRFYSLKWHCTPHAERRAAYVQAMAVMG